MSEPLREKRKRWLACLEDAICPVTFSEGERDDLLELLYHTPAWNQRPEPAGEMKLWIVEDLRKIAEALGESVLDVPKTLGVLRRIASAIASHLSAPDGVEKPVECLGKAMAPGEDYEDDFCDLYEASEIGAPCKGQCYYATHPQRTQGEPAQGERERADKVKGLVTHIYNCGYNRLARLLPKAEAELLSLLATPQSSETGTWVSVGDRLPETNEDVWVCVRYQDSENWRIKESWIYPPAQRQAPDCLWAMGSAKNYAVSHWMPIPALPRAILQEREER